MTELNLNQPVPQLFEDKPIKTKTMTIPFVIEEDLKKYSRIYITKQFNPFRIVHCCEAPFRDYEIYGEAPGAHKVPEKKLLFTSSLHYECCDCCDHYVIGDLCCGYVCCDSIQFQMDYRRNEEPFFVQGFNITKGCHCCDICLYQLCQKYCAPDRLYLRETIDIDNPTIEELIPHTRFKNDIGNLLSPLVNPVLKADEDYEDKKIKLYGDYSASIPKRIFTEGLTMEEMIDIIINKIQQ